jgi:hypothetical protein
MHTRLYLKRGLALLTGLAVVTFLGMYLSGAFCWGYESYEIYSTNTYSKSRYGASFGRKRVYLLANDTLIIRYEASIRKGHLTLHVFKPFKPFGAKDSVSRTVYNSGQGEFILRIRESCYYVICISPHPGNGGYDLSYEATWSRR